MSTRGSYDDAERREELTERVKERHDGDDAAAERGGVEHWSGVRSGATSVRRRRKSGGGGMKQIWHRS